jgi:hypothetical protein
MNSNLHTRQAWKDYFLGVAAGLVANYLAYEPSVVNTIFEPVAYFGFGGASMILFNGALHEFVQAKKCEQASQLEELILVED